MAYWDQDASPANVATARDYARLMALVHIGRDGCWHWIGSRDEYGYARCWFHGRNWHGTALFWGLAGREAPQEGQELHHQCENRSCVNPAHLEPLSKFKNLQRAWERRRQRRREERQEA